MKQLSLFEDTQKNIDQNTENWGTFKDSLKAPIHSWFTYPAGFSYKAVSHSIDRFDIKENMIVYDPFMGSGTTNLTCKTLGISSYGMEAHSFVYNIAITKLNWSLNRQKVVEFIKYVEEIFNKNLDNLEKDNQFNLTKVFPELVIKCYEEITLKKLFIIKKIFEEYNFDLTTKNFFYVVITALLREISTAATGWPYIAPKKAKITSSQKDTLEEFMKISYKMLEDINIIKSQSNPNYMNSQHNLFLGSSVNTSNKIASNLIDFVFTSPPYLNNFDYADRTRLELYFWGEAKTWSDISHNFRDKLMTSATTQISRTNPKYKLSNNLINTCPKVANFLQNAVDELSILRKIKGGKKSYDLMVGGYFNDMFQVLQDVYRVLKPNSYAIFVLGDSAPYGVHIPTDKLIGEIGCNIGFSQFDVEILRKRGDKWKANPQRHNISLQESMVILYKK